MRVLTGSSGSFVLSVEEYCGIVSGTLGYPQDAVERPKWVRAVIESVSDGNRLPIRLSAKEAAFFADELDDWLSYIPGPEIGRILNDELYMTVNGIPSHFIVTSQKGWVEIDDRYWPFIGEGKKRPEELVTFLKRGPVTIDVAA